MAQAGERVARRTARRYGLVGWGRVAGAVVALALVVTIVCLAVGGDVLAWGGGEVEIERAPPLENAAEPQEGKAEEAEEAVPSMLVVHVDGSVANPGVYELEEGARVGEAVEAAGGLTKGADTTSINLAAPLVDGEKVHVPAEGEVAQPTTGEGGEDVLINLNTAGIEELDELPGVGESTARAIVEDREANGPFNTPEDLMRVSGIGEKKYAKLEGMICV